MSRQDRNDPSKGSPSHRQMELAYQRRTAFASLLAAGAAIVASFVAVTSMLSRDMVHENIKLAAANGALHTQHGSLLAQQVSLLRDRVGLLAENNALRDVRQDLLREQAVVDEELKVARAERDQLSLQGRQMRDTLTERASQIRAQTQELARLSRARDQLQGQTRLLSTQLDKTAGTVLRAAMQAHLAADPAKFTQLATQADYRFLYPSADALLSEHGSTAWFFAAVPAGDLAADELSQSCLVQPGVRLIGTYTSFDASGMAYRAVAKDHPLLKRICAYLSQVHSLYSSNRQKLSLTSFELLRRPSSQVVSLSFLPGEYDGLPHEQLRAGGYWLPAFGMLYRGQFIRRLNAENDGALRFMLDADAPRDAPNRIRWHRTLTEIQAEAASPTVEPVRRQFQPMNLDWLGFLKTASIDLGSRTERLMKREAFMPLIPRISFKDIGSLRFFEARDQVKEFDYAVRCLAERFAAREQYLGSLGDEGVACGMRDNALRLGRAAAEQIVKDAK